MILLIHRNNYNNPQTTTNLHVYHVSVSPCFFQSTQQKKWHNKKIMYFSLLPFFLVPHLIVVSFFGREKTTRYRDTPTKDLCFLVWPEVQDL